MEEQIKELTLLLLYLNSWIEKEPYGEFHRAWKGYDFDILKEKENNELEYLKHLQFQHSIEMSKKYLV